MRKRRVLLGIGAGLLLAALLARWSKALRSDVSVALVFVGYTNKVLKIDAHEIGFPDHFIVLHASSHYFPVPLLRATNDGEVPVQLRASFRQASLGRRGFKSPSGTGVSHVLKPGDSTTIEVELGDYRDPWWTEVSCRRHGLLEQIYGWVCNSGNSTFRNTARHLLGVPNLFHVESGWITNPPPSPYSVPGDIMPSRRYHITSPIPFEPIDLSTPVTLPTNATRQR